MATISSEQLLEQLKWRYATKAFDASRQIPADLWASLEQTLVLSPSSYGLQPYQFLIVTNRPLREKLVPHSWGQRQVADCSHLVVLAARKRIGEPEVERHVQRIASVRGVAPESLNFYRNMILSDLINGPRAAIAPEWTVRQAYIALGNLLTCAALLGVDACPLEGFIPDRYDELLGLENGEYRAAVACALGYRATTDKYASLPKVRAAEADLIKRIA